MTIDLRHGDWRKVLLGEGADTLLTDPPYSGRTHQGYRSGDTSGWEEGAASALGVQNVGIEYAAMTPDRAMELAALWAPRVRQWAVIFGDHISFRWHEAAWQAAGWYTFAPVVWTKTNGGPRKAGDGPASTAEHILVARPRSFPRDMGSRPGWYGGPQVSRATVRGQKPEWLIRALLADYSAQGDVIADPYSGSGTTAACAQNMGRHFIGSEVNEQVLAEARRRIEAFALTPYEQGSLPL